MKETFYQNSKIRSPKGGDNPTTFTHPIDHRLAALGKSRAWLARQVGRSEQAIGNYCSQKTILWPDSRITKRLCQVLQTDINYLVLGFKSTNRK